MMTDLCPIAVSHETMTEGQPKTAAEALFSFMKKKRLCDVTFKFENSPERIEAHQLCLRSRSPVFDSMFRGRGSVGEMVELEVEDVKPDVFQKFMQFIYSDKMDATPVEAVHLQHLGQKYKVQPLIEKCEALLFAKLPVENALEIYEAADKYGILRAREWAADGIARSLKNLLQDPQLLTAKETTLIELLKRNDLKVREVDLFSFIVRWGQESSTGSDNLPQILARLLPKLRFTNMNPEEFTTIVMPTKLVPAEDALDIYAYLNGNHSTRTALVSKLKYSTSCRCGELDEMFDFYESGPSDEDDQHEKISFYEGKKPLRECISFNVRGVTEMSSPCPDLIKKAKRKLHLTSIQIQWPSLPSDKVNVELIYVSVLKRSLRDRKFQELFSAALINFAADCVFDNPIHPTVEISEEAEYCIAIQDYELFYHEPFDVLYRYRYSSDAYPCGPLKSSVVGGFLTNVEVYNVRRNACRQANCHSDGYNGFHVIRGMTLEFSHDNPTD